MPALFNFQNNFLIVVFFVSLVVFYGLSGWVVWLGLIFAIISELYFGYYFGSLSISWLAMAWIWHIVNQFFSIRPYESSSFWAIIIHVCFGFLLMLVMAFGWLAISYLYENNASLSSIVSIIKTPSAIIYAGLALCFYLLLMRKLSNYERISSFN